MDVATSDALWANDQELFSLARRELYTAVVGDIMDQLGLLHQFLPPNLRPLDPSMVVIGRTMTVLEADCEAAGEAKDSANPVMVQPFGLMLDALDSLKPGEVYLCSGASPTYALWGELMSERAMKLGANGAVVNGYSRDTHGILSLGFPTFSHGPYAQDQAPRGKVIDYRCPLRIGATHIEPGDIVFGDLDGVCIIPREREREVFTQALTKARGENTVRQAIRQGLSARDAFDQYGIL